MRTKRVDDDPLAMSRARRKRRKKRERILKYVLLGITAAIIIAAVWFVYSMVMENVSRVYNPGQDPTYSFELTREVMFRTITATPTLSPTPTGTPAPSETPSPTVSLTPTLSPTPKLRPRKTVEGSAAELLETVGADQVRMPDYEGTRPEYAAFLAALEAHPETEVQRVTGTETLEIPAGSVNTSLTIYAADDPAEIQNTDGEYDNDMSLVVDLTCGEKKFLFTGDIEKTRIRQMLESQVDWNADWIKMPHHGRYQKKVEKLLEAVRPSYAVICDGDDEEAEEETLDALKKRQIEEWETADGTVVTVTDGKNIEIRQ